VAKVKEVAQVAGRLEDKVAFNAILWLVSDDARYVTGVTLPVDAGVTNKK
jgi:NAD(P)-dependent dehydrogenase (short-subunit alcohol dehydrogenase family)